MNCYWKVVQPPLVWRDWGDGESLVYHPASGDTHLVNEVTAEVLRQLEREKMDLRELSRAVATAFDAPLDAELEESIAKLLAYLDPLGLIEASP